MLHYTIDHQWDEQSSQAVMDGLRSFNEPFLGTDKPQKLAIIVRNDEGQVVAGLLGETKWNWIYISWLWVSDNYRMHRIGTRLMKDAEREANDMGCHHAHLTTLDFQARGFYEKLGYEVFATLEDYPPGHTRFLMKKRIG